jgi:hypothetical protein
MENQPSAPAAPATSAYQQPHCQPSDHQEEYNEKDEQCHQHHVPKVERASKASCSSRARDSVISHPLSPKPRTTPPSPASSVHRSEIQHHSKAVNDELSFPPRAHLDPEKAGAGASPHRQPPSRVSASNPDVTAVVYDSGEYHEKGPEDKPVQLLVSPKSIRRNKTCN